MKNYWDKRTQKQLARDLFNNNFSREYGTPSKNILLLNDLYYEDVATTFHRTDFSKIPYLMLNRIFLFLTSLYSVFCHRPFIFPHPLFIHSILFQNH